MKLKPLEGRGNEYLFTRDETKWIWVSRSKKGYKRLQQSLDTESPAIARQERDKLFAQVFGENPTFAPRVKQINNELWPPWEMTKARKSEATQDSVYYAGRHLLPEIGGMVPDAITEVWWENTYIPKKREEDSDRKFFNEWKWLTTYLNYLHRQGIISRLPKLENPDPPTEEGLNLEDSEIQALYDYGNEDLGLQIDLGFKHFMRRSEVLLMPYAEIDQTKKIIVLPPQRVKTRKGRIINLSDDTFKKLMVRKALSNSPFVFPSPKDPMKPVGRLGNQSAWEGAIERANKDKFRIRPEATFHDLRHSGLSRAFVATNRYLEICIMAGLDLKVALKTYLHLKPEHTRFVADLVKLTNIGTTANDKI